MIDNIDESSIPSERRALLGVSLGNRTFDGEFARRLGLWVKRRQFHKLEIVLFDVCEAINYEVFRGLTPAEAGQRTAVRAHDIGRMFERASGRLLGIRCSVRTESETEPLILGFQECHRQLQKSYERRGQFAADVDNQVKYNLRMKIESGRAEIVKRRMRNLAAYVLRELSWFYCYFRADDGMTTEVYPGEEMEVKARLFAGEYERETSLRAISPQPQFEDVSFLLEDEKDWEAQMATV